MHFIISIQYLNSIQTSFETVMWGFAWIPTVPKVLSLILPHVFTLQKRYQAMYSYTAAEADEVSLQEGDLVLDVEPIDEGWVFGCNQRTGQKGMLPANYVRPVWNTNSTSMNCPADLLSPPVFRCVLTSNTIIA